MDRYEPVLDKLVGDVADAVDAMHVVDVDEWIVAKPCSAVNTYAAGEATTSGAPTRLVLRPVMLMPERGVP